jgi:alanine racemase
MFHTSYIEISESAIVQNLAFIRNMLGEVAFSAVVKGNAYGHGIEHYVPILYKHGIQHYSVFNAYEALEVFNHLPEDCTIMNMGMISADETEWAVENGIELFVFDLNRLQDMLKSAKKTRKKALVHLELETGMNRTGLTQKEMNQALALIENNKDHFDVKGVCTHLAGAESIANYKRVKDQYRRFKQYLKKIEAVEWLSPKIHMASSAASIRYPSTRYDMVRIGILQFGFFPTQEILVHYLSTKKNIEDPLKRVISWKTNVMDLKDVGAGKFIGYGTSFFTNVPTKIALIPVGYANGYSRNLSNQGKVLIHGKRFDVIGTVNMSMMAVDITECPEIQRGDEVVLIGNQGDLEISVSSFSNYSNLVNYELLTRLPSDIPRIITQ